MYPASDFARESSLHTGSIRTRRIATPASLVVLLLTACAGQNASGPAEPAGNPMPDPSAAVDTDTTDTSVVTDKTDVATLPLARIEDVTYLGGFALPADEYGDSSLNYSDAIIDVSAGSLFIRGHDYDDAIAQVEIPALGYGTSVDTTLVLADADDRASSPVKAFFRLPGAARSAGWMTELPPRWQAELGMTHLAGASSGYPIVSRHSVGPSFHAVMRSSCWQPIPAMCRVSGRWNSAWTTRCRPICRRRHATTSCGR